MSSSTRVLIGVLLVGGVGCDGDGDPAGPRPDAALPDAATPPDGEPPPDAAPPPDAGACAVPPTETWSGTATHSNGYYPDTISVVVTWQRTATDGCLDSYSATGLATYGYAIPGALCAQSIEPATQEVLVTDGRLTVDRTVAPASYLGVAATRWEVTWHCLFDDGTSVDQVFLGGGTWLDAAGRIGAAAIEGEYEIDDDVACGPSGVPPCTYTWSFTPG
jgi:hypothetical protein